MHKENTEKDYFERINTVLEYINNHLEENLDLKKLASVSNFSEFHFHRIMRAYLNESLGSYMVRLRLDMAARLLRYSKEPIQEIAYRTGYEVPSSFNKAFKKRFNVSPKEFRDSKGFFRSDGTFINPYKTITEMKLKPKIKTIKEKKVIYVQTKGYLNESIGPAWQTLINFMKQNRLFGFKTEFIGISYDDPKITEIEKCRYDACSTVRKEVDPVGQIGFRTISGGTYAVFKHYGPYEKFTETYNAIYLNWLPESGYKLRDTHCFERYLSDASKVKPEKNVTEIYIPIE